MTKEPDPSSSSAPDYAVLYCKMHQNRSRITAHNWNFEPVSSVLLLQDGLQSRCLGVDAQQTAGMQEEDPAIPPLVRARPHVCQEGVPSLASIDAIEDDACAQE